MSEKGGGSNPQEERMAQLLRALGWTVEPPPTPRKLKPVPSCAVCGAVDERAAFHDYRYDTSGIDDDTAIAEWLTKIRVEVGERGEEGWDFKTLLFCEYHDAAVITQIMALGFRTHHHGSTHPLADPDCPGDPDYTKCPVTKGEISNPYYEDEE